MTKRIEKSELIQSGPAEGLSSLLGVRLPDFQAGEGLPMLWHWLYCLDRPAQQDLGVDGHPVRGVIPEPPGPGLRRMWAGGRVRQLRPLFCGDSATRITTIGSIREKQGKSGPLTFVTVRQQMFQAGHFVIDEEQDIVYRAPTDRDQRSMSRVNPIPLNDDEWSVELSPTLLFRFSALTYNSHRIHYDRDYARDAEGYPGLVTHGPLQAIVMAEAARAVNISALGTASFEYRLVAPLFDFQGLVARAVVDGRTVSTSIRDVAGRQTAIGSITTDL